MPKSQLQEFLSARIGGKGKLTAAEVAAKGGLAASYISALMSGAKTAESMSVDAVCRLAKGLGESPITVFRAATGRLQSGFSSEDMEQILLEFQGLDRQGQKDLAFMITQLRRMIQERQTTSRK